jgi:hypothetical protein
MNPDIGYQNKLFLQIKIFFQADPFAKMGQIGDVVCNAASEFIAMPFTKYKYC